MTNDILCDLDGGDGSCLHPSQSVFCLWCYWTPCLYKTSHGFFGVPQNLISWSYCLHSLLCTSFQHVPVTYDIHLYTQWSYSLHSLLCTSLLFDYNSLSLQPVFWWWRTATSNQFSWSDTAVLTIQTCNDASLMWRYEWPKTKWNWKTRLTVRFSLWIK